MFFISCNKEQNDAFYELRYNLPDYFKEYDYKSYLKENNISNFGSHISGEYASYKDSGNTTFLTFKRNDFNDITRLHNFQRLSVENKLIIETEQTVEWIETYVGKKGCYDFYFYEYEDITSKTYNALLLWSFEDHSIGISFYTNEQNNEKIADFKEMIDNITYYESKPINKGFEN